MRKLFELRAWCSQCKRYRKADIGPDPKVDGRQTEILRRHWRGLRVCPGSHTDANPVA